MIARPLSSSTRELITQGDRLLGHVPLELLPRAVELGQQGAQVLACTGEGVGAAGGETRLLLTVDESLSSQVGESVGEDLVAQ